MVSATRDNLDQLIEFVNNLGAGDGTNFAVAFDAAFDILSNGAKSCRTAILFLTDGKADDVSDLIKQRNNDDINAVVFSYTLGSQADVDVPRTAAEITNGIYTHIDDGDSNLISKMSSYYIYYAYGSHEDDNNIVITSPYLDYDTGVAMVYGNAGLFKLYISCRCCWYRSTINIFIRCYW